MGPFSGRKSCLQADYRPDLAGGRIFRIGRNLSQSVRCASPVPDRRKFRLYGRHRRDAAAKPRRGDRPVAGASRRMAERTGVRPAGPGRFRDRADGVGRRPADAGRDPLHDRGELPRALVFGAALLQRGRFPRCRRRKSESAVRPSADQSAGDRSRRAVASGGVADEIYIRYRNRDGACLHPVVCGIIVRTG